MPNQPARLMCNMTRLPLPKGLRLSILGTWVTKWWLVCEPTPNKMHEAVAQGWRVAGKDNCGVAELINHGVHCRALKQFTHKDSTAVCVKIYPFIRVGRVSSSH